MSPKILFFLVLLLLIGFVFYNKHSISGHFFWIKSTWFIKDVHSKKSLKLNSYYVDIDAKKVSGIDRNLSGLTYNPATDTLFSVVNDPPAILELSKEGDLIRKIPVDAVKDLEGISHIRFNQFVITDERDQKIIEVNISRDTTYIHKKNLSHIKIGLGKSDKNKGFEGVEWDESRQTLFIIKEKSPKMIYALRGFPPQSNQYVSIEVDEWKPTKHHSSFTSDLSSIFIHQKTGNILLLGEESKLIAEYQYEGDFLSMLKLRAGYHGLTNDVPQAEGLAIDHDDFIYVVSEPNLFYRFKKNNQQSL
jgi:uncharacterized protein YjiK